MNLAAQKITPNLWFDNNAEDAVKFYCSIFKNAHIGQVTRFSQEGFEIHKMPADTIMTIEFTLEGQRFVALNGGPIFKFNEAISFIINCDTQMEIDYYWDKLSENGDPGAQQCGWLKDKYGLSWQIVPVQLTEMLTDAQSQKAQKVMHAMLQMKKIDLQELLEAHNN